MLLGQGTVAMAANEQSFQGEQIISNQLIVQLKKDAPSAAEVFDTGSVLSYSQIGLDGAGTYLVKVNPFDSLATNLARIQAIKGVEVGDGFETTRRRGSVAHDELFATDEGIARETDRAGGIEGGMSTGTVLRVRAGMKPIATVPHALRTIDTSTGEAAPAHHQRATAAGDAQADRSADVAAAAGAGDSGAALRRQGRWT